MNESFEEVLSKAWDLVDGALFVLEQADESDANDIRMGRLCKVIMPMLKEACGIIDEVTS